MAKREFLQLCHKFKGSPENMYMSEKLDGQRAFWDGGISRGCPASQVPYANIAKGGGDKIATGLWTRYAKIIHAPDWWLDDLPAMPLDGELYTRHNDRQNLRSIVSRLEPDLRWDDVRYYVFGSPPLRTVLADGKIDNLHFKKEFKGCYEWASERLGGVRDLWPTTTFEDTYQILCSDVKGATVLPQLLVYTEQQMRDYLDEVVSAGGEGIILQARYAYWEPERTYNCLKLKDIQDAEAEVLGYTEGLGKLKGMMGSLKVRWNGKIFYLSGFTESERLHAKKEFPIGSKVTFRYRGVSDDGTPIEARYWRKHEPV